VEVSVLDRHRAGSHTIPLGYSYKSSQYGLTVDNIAGYELVLPNGTITHVTSKDKELWFGLRVSGKNLIRIDDAEGLRREGRIILYATNFAASQIHGLLTTDYREL